MYLALSRMISEIDDFAENTLNIPKNELMRRSGEAVAQAVTEILPSGSSILFLCGKGNNGGDGYVAARLLMKKYDVTVCQIFDMPYNREECKNAYFEYVRAGGKILIYENCGDLSFLNGAALIVDAIFGTGCRGEIPEMLKPLIRAVNGVGAKILAIDLPIGINADDGCVAEDKLKADVTVALSFLKPGLISYPAKEYTGKIIYSSLALPIERIVKAFDFSHYAIDEEWAAKTLPKREDNSNKGSFGKALLIVGSDTYKGAAYLSLEAALRGGAGLVSFLGDAELASELLPSFPEVIYNKTKKIPSYTREDVEKSAKISKKYSSVLIGSGSSSSEGLKALLISLLSDTGEALVLDADAINTLAELGDDGREILAKAKRELVLTPHPLEFSRISGFSLEYIQSHRLESAQKFASEHNLTLVLKGAATIVTDGKTTYINTKGSSALAKAGSGDVLAGLTVSLLAMKRLRVIEAAALAVYLHSNAADRLASKYSSYGVTPKDLPREIAKVISEMEQK